MKETTVESEIVAALNRIERYFHLLEILVEIRHRRDDSAPPASARAKPGRVVGAVEFAERLGCSRTTLWRWIQAGKLPPRRTFGPGRAGWLESEVNACVREMRPGRGA